MVLILALYCFLFDRLSKLTTNPVVTRKEEMIWRMQGYNGSVTKEPMIPL